MAPFSEKSDQSFPFSVMEGLITGDVKANRLDTVSSELNLLKVFEGEEQFTRDLSKLNQDLHDQHILPYFEIIQEGPQNPAHFVLKNLSSSQKPVSVPQMEGTPSSGNYEGSGRGPGASGNGSDGAGDGGDGNSSIDGDGSNGDEVSAISDPGGDPWDGQSAGDMSVSDIALKSIGSELWCQGEAPAPDGNEGCAATVSDMLEHAGYSYAASASVDGGNPGSGGLAGQLTSHGWTQSRGLDGAQPGTVLYGDNGGDDQHIGIVAVDRGQLVVINNWSNDGKVHEEPLKSSYIATHFGNNVFVLHPPATKAGH